MFFYIIYIQTHFLSEELQCHNLHYTSTCVVRPPNNISIIRKSSWSNNKLYITVKCQNSTLKAFTHDTIAGTKCDLMKYITNRLNRFDWMHLWRFNGILSRAVIFRWGIVGSRAFWKNPKSISHIQWFTIL